MGVDLRESLFELANAQQRSGDRNVKWDLMEQQNGTKAAELCEDVCRFRPFALLRPAHKAHLLLVPILQPFLLWMYLESSVALGTCVHEEILGFGIGCADRQKA